jgi:hypothetical protein
MFDLMELGKIGLGLDQIFEFQPLNARPMIVEPGFPWTFHFAILH